MRQLDPLTKRRQFERVRMLDCAPVCAPQPVRRATSGPPRPVFAHRVEAALAEVFDEYRIAWLYEPHTFPLERADDGTLTRAFTPDFFLPEIGIYVEVHGRSQGTHDQEAPEGPRRGAALRHRGGDRLPGRPRGAGTSMVAP